MVPLDQVKAVIIGQDPAPQPGLATGLAFSLDESVHPTKVPSVQRVILEARNEGYCVDPEKGVLINWAEQGVVLLNTALTLIQDEIGSHIDVWANFTHNLIEYINENASPSVWILWGSHAKQLEDKIDHSKHYVLKGGPPLTQCRREILLLPELFFLCKRLAVQRESWHDRLEPSFSALPEAYQSELC